MYEDIDLKMTKEEILRNGDPYDYFLYLMYNGHDDDVYNALLNSTAYNAAQAQFHYCLCIEDKEEMWRAMLNADPAEAFESIILYCIKVKKRPELLEHIVTMPNLLRYIW